MDYKSKVAQTRLEPSIFDEVHDRLDNTGLTMSDYLRLLVLKDLDRLPIQIPKNLPTMKLTKEEEKSLDIAMEDVLAGRVRKVNDVDEYLDDLLKKNE